MSTPNYGWLLDAAGTDSVKLAHLSLLVAAESFMLTQTITAENRMGVLSQVNVIRSVMREITERIASNLASAPSTEG